MKSIAQELAEKINMTADEFAGEMRKRGCSEPTILKIWRGDYEHYKDFKDNDIYISNLRKAAFVLRVPTGRLLPIRKQNLQSHPWVLVYNNQDGD
jgi:hypothetical protein